MWWLTGMCHWRRVTMLMFLLPPVQIRPRRFKETKKSGLTGTGGIGFTIGSSKTSHDRREAGTTQSQSASTIGSTAGNVSITAGKQAHISGSDVIANRDISITGDSVVVDPGHDRRTVDEKI